MLYNPPPGGTPPMSGGPSTLTPQTGAAQAPAGVTDPSLDPSIGGGVMAQPTMGSAQAPSGITSGATSSLGAGAMPGLATPPPTNSLINPTSYATQNTQPQMPSMGGLGLMDGSGGMMPSNGQTQANPASFDPQNTMINALNQTGAGTSQLNPNYNPAAFA